MSYMLRLYIINPDPTVPLYPPNILASEWYARAKDFVSFPPATKFFRNLEEVTAFINEIKLTDPALQSSLAEWKSTYGITIEQYCYEIPDVSGLPSVFG